MKSRILLAACAFALAAPAANAALLVTPTDDVNVLTSAMLDPASNILIEPGSIVLVGAASQQGTYSGFNLSATGLPTIAITDGVVLTSGTANFSTTTNTVNNFSVNSGTGADADLSDLLVSKGLSSSTLNSNSISFNFTVTDPTANAVMMQFVFGTDEFPTQSVTDGMAIFIDGINYAFFPNGNLVANQSGTNDQFFNLNPVGSSEYGIEWNGLTNTLTVVGLLDLALAVHTFKLVIADTSDTIFDSAVFFSGLKATFTTGTGGIGDVDVIPVPAAFPLMLFGIAAIGAAARRRRKA